MLKEKNYKINDDCFVTILSFDEKLIQKFCLLIEIIGSKDGIELNYRVRYEYPSTGNRDEKFAYFDDEKAKSFYKSAIKFIMS
jgi:hypothetical protein